MSKSKIIPPKQQRALVFQGGVALGAYEAGVFDALYEKIKKQDPNWKKSMFDIVAGTSAGAINAAILVSYVKEHKTWEGSADRLLDFWKCLSSPTPFFARSYGYLLGEAARRYYSAKHFFYEGATNVFSPPEIMPDTRFHDYLPFFNFKPNVNPNTSFVYSNDWWKESLEHYYYKDRETSVASLSTRYEAGEPRLLVVSVDVGEGTAVAFDSYSKESVYGYYDKESKEYREYTIHHEKGLTPVHIMASAAYPVYFDFRKVPLNYDYNKASNDGIGIGGDFRHFWDGGVLSNTPLRELLSEHKLFWEKEIKRIAEESNLIPDIIWAEKEEEKESANILQVPDLEVFIVNVWPKVELNIPSDHEGVKDRKNDIAYCDKTNYDQKVAVLVSDYIKLAKKIRKIALTHIPQNRQQGFKDELDTFLKENDAESRNRKGELRKFEEIIKGRFRLINVVTIERTDDIYDISNKWADFSEESIQRLIDKGREDAERVDFKVLLNQNLPASYAQ
jgi:NTE family protein